MGTLGPAIETVIGRNKAGTVTFLKDSKSFEDLRQGFFQ